MSWILLVVLVALVFAIGYGLYTRRGTGVSKHPYGSSDIPDHPDEDEEEPLKPGVDESEGTLLDQRGTDTRA